MSLVQVEFSFIDSIRKRPTLIFLSKLIFPSLCSSCHFISFLVVCSWLRIKGFYKVLVTALTAVIVLSCSN